MCLVVVEAQRRCGVGRKALQANPVLSFHLQIMCFMGDLQRTQSGIVDSVEGKMVRLLILCLIRLASYS